MQLHPKQQEVAKDKTRFRLLNWGRKSGKTDLIIEELIGYASVKKYTHGKRPKLSYIGEHRKEAKRIAWDRAKIRTKKIWAKDPNESNLELYLLNNSLDLGKGENYSTIYFDGWESISALIGEEFDFLGLDEVSKFSNFLVTWQTVLRPTLGPRKGEAMFISRPQGFNHWYDLCQLEKTNNNYKTFHATAYENPYVDKEEIEEAKKELDADTFAQEYLADFRKITGAVCKWFNRDIHLKYPEGIRSWYISIDGGWSDPLAYLLVGMDHNDNVYVADGFRETEMDEDAIEHMHKFVLEQNSVDELEDGTIDSDDPRLEDNLNQRGISVTGVKKVKGDSKTFDEELAKRMFQYGRVEDGMTKLFIAPHLTWLIQEIESLAWKENTSGERLPQWNDHRQHGHHYDGMRALAYFLLEFTEPLDTLVFQSPAEEKVNQTVYDPDEELAKRKNPWR